MSFTVKILAGLGLGTAVGWFLGPRAEPFRPLADAFVRLLEMTVLPYLTVSLVAGIGGLEPARARKLFVRGGAITLGLWGLALAIVLLMPIAFPEIQNASFFSTTLVEDRPRLDLVSLYVPSNPFHSLANTVVPAVVVFSVVLAEASVTSPPNPATWVGEPRPKLSQPRPTRGNAMKSSAVITKSGSESAAVPARNEAPTTRLLASTLRTSAARLGSGSPG